MKKGLGLMEVLRTCPEKDVSWFVLCARALGFAAFHRRDERMNENMLCLLLSGSKPLLKDKKRLVMLVKKFHYSFPQNKKISFEREKEIEPLL